MSKLTFDRFLKELRDPVPQAQIARATTRVLESLETGESPRLAAARAPVVEGSPSWGWSAFVAVAAGLVTVAALHFILLQPIDGNPVARTAEGRTYLQAESIQARDGAMHLLLIDGSRVEMNPGAALSISWDSLGIRIFLSSGQVTVMAAKQRAGRLYVKTPDCEVSVVGTVFSVKAGPEGSRVSVVEGEVVVRQGEQRQTLLPGQEVSAGIAGVSTPVEAEIVESRETLEPKVMSPAPQESVLPQEPGTLTGKVVRHGTNEVLPEVAITVCRDPEVPNLQTEGGQASFTVAFGGAMMDAVRCDPTASVTTDNSGRFTIKDLPPGRYVARGRKSGYVAPFALPLDTRGPGFSRNEEKWSYEGAPAFSVQQFTMGQESRPVDVSIAMVRAGRVAGMVRNTDFKKFEPYVPVHLGVVSGTGTFTALAAVNSNASGEYRFRVPPGDYRLFAGALPQGSSFPVPRDAVRVSVKEGEEITAEALPYRDPNQR